jgi:hypothetical protein
MATAPGQMTISISALQHPDIAAKLGLIMGETKRSFSNHAGRLRREIGQAIETIKR